MQRVDGDNNDDNDIDDEYVGETKFVHELSRIMTEGEHLVTAVDADGNRIQQKFSIISNEN